MFSLFDKFLACWVARNFSLMTAGDFVQHMKSDKKIFYRSFRLAYMDDAVRYISAMFHLKLITIK